VATVPAPHDPDSFIKQCGAPAFQELITKAESFFDYYLNRLCATHDLRADSGQLAVVKAMAEALRKADNLVLTDKYAQKTAARLSVAIDAVRAQFKKGGKARVVAAEPGSAEIETSQPPETSATAREYWLLKLLLLNDELCEWAAAHLDTGWIQHATVRELVLRRLKASPEPAAGSATALLNEVTDDQARSLVTRALAESRTIPNTSQQLHDVVLRLRNQHLDQQIESLTRRAADPSLADPEKIEALRRRQQLHLAKQQPLTPLADTD
jgi:DNA primase